MGPQEIESLKSGFSHFAHRDFRPGQAEAIDYLCSSQRKNKILQAPTGSGKSLVGMCVGAHSKTCLYLCSSKQLQTQLSEDFPEVVVMWGRGNFECGLIPTITASECVHSGSKWQCEVYKKGMCEYEERKKEAIRSPIAVLNYHYALTEMNFVGRFSNRAMIICDEADTLESILADYVSLRFGRRMIENLDLSIPRRKTSQANDAMDVWADWVDNAKEKAGRICQDLQFKLNSTPVEDPEYILVSRELQSYQNVVHKGLLFKENMDKTWLFDYQEYDGELKKIEFKPTWLPGQLIHESFFKHSKDFVFMSATFPPRSVLANMYSFDLSDIDWFELPSSFPAENRPVIVRPVGDMRYKTFNRDIEAMVKGVLDVCNQHPNEKGIIHTVSWKLNQYIMGAGNGRFITHDGSNKADQLEKFIKSKKPLVFVSPSSTRGVDLPYDACRFAIITKMPFQSLGDKLVSSRVYSSKIGKVWYRSDACQELVQGCGRGMRFHDDTCVTYILDKQAAKIVMENRSLLPKYFLEAVDI